ncbi:MAG: rubrerythrin family protein, partial [Oscillospiraceae bacterium]|nr:rubrerythrin family protein [Oscillospiraceae bacterium]
MSFMQTQTCVNLAKSFAGESQARNRYTVYAAQARKEGYEYLARIFDETADNEKIHAEEFLEKLQKYGHQPIENIDICAGFPYTLGVTMENFLYASRGENEEHTDIYPAYAATAMEEGHADIAALWEQISVVEGVHRDVFMQAYEQLQTGSLYKKDQPVVWRCLNCGH